MRTIVLIAVRLKSNRLPGKALAMVENQTVIEHLIDRISLAKLPSDFILCTSTNPQDDPLDEIAKKKGIACFRGSEDDVLKRFIDCAEREKADIIVRVTGDNIFTDPEYIDRLIDHQVNSNADYVIATGLPKGVKAESMILDAMKKAHEMADNPEMSEYMTLYFKGSGFFHDEELKADKSVNRPEYRLTIDAQEDLELIRRIFNELGKNGRYFSLKEIVDFLDHNQNLLKINASIKERKIALKIIEKSDRKMMRIVVE